jgi:hypothetical protein
MLKGMPSTTKLVAWVGNGVGFISWTPYVEGDKIKMKGMRLRENREIRNRFVHCLIQSQLVTGCK